MIAYLKGELLERSEDRGVVLAGGVGYEVHLTPTTASRLPAPGREISLFISESTAMYGGGTTLYGFLSKDEQKMFLTFKELPSTGAKKAMEHLEKVSRSLPDFRRAILDGDMKVMTGMFRFTKKTAEKLIAGLKDKLGPASTQAAGRATAIPQATGAMGQALEALAALGYRPSESRTALEAVSGELSGRQVGVEEIIRRALKRL